MPFGVPRRLDLWDDDHRVWVGCAVTLGRASRQGDLLDGVTRFCDDALAPNSIYGFLYRERDVLFADEVFADLFTGKGRRSVPPSVVAVVMVLQRLEGLSDREAVDRFTYDARWRYAAGVGGWDGAGRVSFVHTVLVDMRERLRKSDRPDRIFEAALGAAREAGLIGRRRVVDSTPLYDAVATMDTITLIRSAIRGLLAVVDGATAVVLRALMTSGDEYASAAKPSIDWDDTVAREALVDSRARDGYAMLAALDGQKLTEPVAQAAALLATVLGQDLDEDADGVFHIARRVAKNRTISTVDPESRHGHKTNHKGFDGYKGHVAADPDSEIITATKVTSANTPDGQVAADLIDDLITEAAQQAKSDQPGSDEAGSGQVGTGGAEPAGGDVDADGTAPFAVYGDAAYGTGDVLAGLEPAGIDPRTKVAEPVSRGGRYSKKRFRINLPNQTVTCPNDITVTIRPVTGNDRIAGQADFRSNCATCPLAAQCTDSATGRSITIGHHEARLAAARDRQHEPARKADYKATRPKIERKIAHLMRRRHGGRRARVRGLTKINADFGLLAAAVNLARLAKLGLATYAGHGWAI